jgi:hypothetical protein
MKNRWGALIIALSTTGGAHAADLTYNYLGVDMVGVALNEPVVVAGKERKNLVGGGFEGSWAFYKDFFLRGTSYGASSRENDEDDYFEQSESSFGVGAAWRPTDSASLFIYIGGASAETNACTLPTCTVAELSGARYELGARMLVTDSLELGLSGNQIAYDKDADYSSGVLSALYYFTPRHSMRLTLTRTSNSDDAVSIGYRYNWGSQQRANEAEAPPQ